MKATFGRTVRAGRFAPGYARKASCQTLVVKEGSPQATGAWVYGKELKRC